MPLYQHTKKNYTSLLMHFDDNATLSSTISSVYSPMQGAISPDGTKAYLGSWGASSLTNGVHVIDVATNTKTATIATPLCPIHMVTNSTGTRVYTSAYGATSASNSGNVAYIMDATNNTLLSTVTVGTGSHSVAITPNDKFLFVSCDGAGASLHRIDLTAATPTATLVNTGAGWGVGISPDGTKLYLSSGSSVLVYSLNQTTGAISLIATLTGFSNAWTYGATDTHIYYANQGAGTVIPIRFSDNTKETAITVGSGPYGVMVSPDKKKVFVANNLANTVSVIDAASRTVIDTLTGFNAPRGGAASNGKVFIGNNGNSTVGVSVTKVFADLSPVSLAQYRVGSSYTSTTQSKFGGRSLSLDGTNTNKLVFSNINNSGVKQIDLSNKPFTIEGWFYRSSATTGVQPLVCFGTSADGQGPMVYFESSNQLAFAMSTSGSGWTDTTALFTPTANAWHHFAVVRETTGGNIKLYCDGSLKGTISTSSAVHTGNFMWIGHYPYFSGGAKTLNGYIDEVKIEVGRGAYTGDFTPPTAPF